MGYQVYSQSSMPADSVFGLLKPSVNAGPSFPAGNFNSTHLPGLTASYIRNFHSRSLSPFTKKWLGFTSQAGLAAWPGKKVTIGNGNYRYGWYSLAYLQGGCSWLPGKKKGISLLAGPAAGYYLQVFRFAVTGELQAAWQITDHSVIRPRGGFIKETKTRSLWNAGFQYSYIF